ASHFAPKYMEEAISIYREEFKPSPYLNVPYMMVCINVIAAESNEEAAFLKTTMDQFFLNIIRGTSEPLKAPIENMENVWNPSEKGAANSMLRYSFIGDKEKIHEQFVQFQEKYQV